MTSVSCLTRPSIPLVQWNTQPGRDVDLAVWDEVQQSVQAPVQASNLRRWACRSAKAVWRGALSEHYVTNQRWTLQRKLSRQAMSTKLWRKQGRLALMGQQCSFPELLDVHLSGVHGQGHHILAFEDAEYHQCIHAMLSGVATSNVPKWLTIHEQAARYRYVVHVEGVGGWADRLRHLLLSGALVLKQETGVVEWFEPLLAPFVHYVPVSSTLHNLSAAVRWAREHDAEAQRIAQAGARRMREVSSVSAMAYYQGQLIERYAHAYRRAAEIDMWPLPSKPSLPNITSTAKYHCELDSGVADTNEERRRQTRRCHFATDLDGGKVGATRACGMQLHCELVCMRTNQSRCAMIGIADISADGNRYHHSLSGC